MSMESFREKHRRSVGRGGKTNAPGGNIQGAHKGFSYRRPHVGERSRWVVSREGIDLGIVRRVGGIMVSRWTWRTDHPNCMREFRGRHEAALCLRQQREEETR